MKPADSQPTLLQRAYTWGAHHLLRQPSRKGLAGSLREQGNKLTPKQNELILDLLSQHEIIKPRETLHSLQELQPGHFYGWQGQAKLDGFIRDVNQLADRFKISFVAGQFSIIVGKRATIIDRPSFPIVADSPSFKILSLLEETNRPLTIDNILGELDTLPRETAIKELGKMEGRGLVINTFAVEEADSRYFLSSRLAEVSGSTVFQCSDQLGDHYIYQAEAKRLEADGRLTKMIGPGGYYYVSTFRLIELGDRIEVLTNSGRLYVTPENIEAAIKKGTLIRGVTGEGRSCFIETASQNHYMFEVFNDFTDNYLRLFPEEQQAALYQKIRVAFSAGWEAIKPTSVVEFLYEAKVLAELGAKPKAVLLSFINSPEAESRLRRYGVFNEDELAELGQARRDLFTLFQFPMVFNPEESNSLQNFWHFIYEKSGCLEIFQLLLVMKLDLLRFHAASETPLPPAALWEIRMVYAPLAEQSGYAELANNMRELVFRLTDPEQYQETKARMEANIGMTLEEGRRHLRIRKEELAVMLKSEGLDFSAIRFRLKEVASLFGKGEGADTLGLRVIVKNLKEAYAVAAYLQSALQKARPELVPDGTPVLKDRLAPHDDFGWRGWRGYFHDFSDPLVNGQPSRGRILSIQVLTEEMEKSDKFGARGHAGYKAAREAGHYASEQKKTSFRNQVFLPAPIGQYTSLPEEIFSVNKQTAAGFNRVVIWPADLPFSEKSLVDLAGRKVSHLRIGRGDTIEDILARRAFGNFLIANNVIAEIYQPVLEASGQLTLKPLKGQAKVSRGFVPPSGSIIVFKAIQLTPLTENELAQIRSKANTIRAKLLTNLELAERRGKTREQLLTDPAIAELLSPLSEQRTAELVEALKLRDQEELQLAVAFKLIDRPWLNNLLGIFESKVALEIHNKTESKLSASAPLRYGVLAKVLERLSDSRLLGGQAEIHFDPSGTFFLHFSLYLPARNMNASEEVMREIKELLDSGEQPERSNLIIRRTARIKLRPTGNYKHWEKIDRLAKTIRDLGLNILGFDLPDISENKEREGFGEIIFDFEKDSSNIEERLSRLEEVLKKFPFTSYVIIN